MSDTPAPSRRPLLDVLCDGWVASVAVFTLLANFEVWRGGSLRSLSTLTAIAALATAIGIGLRYMRAAHHVAAPASNPLDAGPDSSTAGNLSGRVAAGVAAASLVAWTLLWLTGSLLAWWIIASVVCVAMLAMLATRPVRIQERFGTRRDAALLAVLALVCSTAVAMAHRGDADDAFYANLVVAAVDRPDAPLLAGDTLHGFDGVPMSLPVFDVLSHELLQAVIARLTGLSALDVVHVVMPPLLALLIPLAYARLLGLLLPGRWALALAVVVGQLCLVGDGRAGYGDFAMLRLHQGKSVLLHVLLPLLTSYGIEFAQRPSRASWLRLAAAQIAALGLSTSGLWLGPAAAAVALASGLSLCDRGATHRSVRTLAQGLLASVYPVVLALSLRADTLQAFREAVHPVESLSWSGEQLMQSSLNGVLGSGPYLGIALFSLIAVHAAYAPNLFRRYAATSTCVFLLLWNPITAPLVASQLTGPDTYFRVFWLLPVPIFIAGLVTDPIERMRGRTPGVRRTGMAGIAGATALFLWLCPVAHTLGAANGVRLGRPGWKLPPVEFGAALRIADYAADGDIVLAPAQISRWLPLIHHHPSPLMVREMYIDLLHDRLGAAEIERRVTLTHAVGGTLRPEASGRMLAEALADYPLEVVCLSGPGLARPELRSALKQSPLEVRYRDADYEIWTRRPEPIRGTR